MPIAANEDYRARLEAWYNGVVSDDVSVPEAEKLLALKLIEEHRAVRRQNMTGDHIEKYCLEMAVASIEWESVCPEWMRQIRAEHALYLALTEEARAGNGLAQSYRNKALSQRPQLETLKALEQSHVERFALAHLNMERSSG